jgi:hypothetical protein
MLVLSSLDSELSTSIPAPIYEPEIACPISIGRTKFLALTPAQGSS